MLRCSAGIFLLLTNVLVGTGCRGKAAMNETYDVPVDPSSLALSVSGTPRLSANEYDNTLKDLLQDTTNSGFAALPQDTADPFDNDYTTQLPSAALVEAAESLATAASQRAVQNPAVLAAILPCQPSGPNDSACLQQFIQQFGRLVLRRPLSPAEVAEYAGLQSYAVEAGDFNVGVQLVLQAMLQDMSFLYRVEIGTPATSAPGVSQLDSYEMASRLSYYLWGSTPPGWLLDQADAAQLGTSDAVRAAATKLLADPHARTRMERFHALWLAYAQLPHSTQLNAAMEAESAALVDKVVFDDASDYFNVFESNETYINDLLAQQYGLQSPGPNGFAWISYGASGRKGILSQGTVLAAGAKFGDTSPTLRGVFVRTRLLCQEVAPPPPDVNPDNPPVSTNNSPCKIDRYSEHAANGSCAGCHNQLDPIGFGLENFDENGVYRPTDVGLPQCPIAGNGAVAGIGSFHGPAGLADLLTGSGQLEQCVATQMFQFAMGRSVSSVDQALIGKVTGDFTNGGRKLDQMMLDYVSDPSYGFIREQ
jgi:hypothetical protein